MKIRPAGIAFVLMSAILCPRAGSAYSLPASSCGGQVWPCFELTLAAGTRSFGQTSAAPLSQSVSGIGGFTSAESFGFATVGTLGVRSQLTTTDSRGSGQATAVSYFEDAFTVNNFSLSTLYLALDFAMTGTMVTSGSGSARVSGELVLLNSTNLDRQTGFLSNAGSTTVLLTLDPGANAVFIAGDLQAYAYTSGLGGAVVDFSHTFALTGAHLANAFQQPLGDVALVDFAGNPLIPAPEPPLGLLTGGSVLALGLLSASRARYCASRL